MAHAVANEICHLRMPANRRKGMGAMTGRFSEEAWRADGDVARRDRPAAVQYRAGRRHRSPRSASASTSRRTRIYLAEYARVLAIAAAKAPDAATVRWFAPGGRRGNRCRAGIARALSGRVRGRSRRQPPPPSRPPIASPIRAICWRRRTRSPGRCWSRRSCRVSGSIGMWPARSSGARRRTTRTAPGSTPTPTRVSARPCSAAIAIADRAAEAATPPIARRDARRLCPLGAVRIPVLGRRLSAARLAGFRVTPSGPPLPIRPPPQAGE